MALFFSFRFLSYSKKFFPIRVEPCLEETLSAGNQIGVHKSVSLVKRMADIYHVYPVPLPLSSRQTKTGTFANSVDLEKTAHHEPSRLIRVYTVCHSGFDFKMK